MVMVNQVLKVHAPFKIVLLAVSEEAKT